MLAMVLLRLTPAQNPAVRRHFPAAVHSRGRSARPPPPACGRRRERSAPAASVRRGQVAIRAAVILEVAHVRYQGYTRAAANAVGSGGRRVGVDRDRAAWAV